MGKTLIAEGAVFEALHRGEQIYYTTPLIALTEQKFRELQAAAVRWGFRADDVVSLGQMQPQREGNHQPPRRQIVSRQPVRPRVAERFQKVVVNARMRCGIEDLKKIVYSLETGVPMIIADEVTVIKPRSRRRGPSNRGPDTSGILDIRFNMSGYLRDSA